MNISPLIISSLNENWMDDMLAGKTKIQDFSSNTITRKPKIVEEVLPLNFLLHDIYFFSFFY